MTQPDNEVTLWEAITSIWNNIQMGEYRRAALMAKTVCVIQVLTAYITVKNGAAYLLSFFRSTP